MQVNFNLISKSYQNMTSPISHLFHGRLFFLWNYISIPKISKFAQTVFGIVSIALGILILSYFINKIQKNKPYNFEHELTLGKQNILSRIDLSILKQPVEAAKFVIHIKYQEQIWIDTQIISTPVDDLEPFLKNFIDSHLNEAKKRFKLENHGTTNIRIGVLLKVKDPIQNNFYFNVISGTARIWQGIVSSQGSFIASYLQEGGLNFASELMEMEESPQINEFGEFI